MQRETELEFEITGNDQQLEARPEVQPTGSAVITGNATVAEPVNPVVTEEDRMEIIELELPVKNEPVAEPEIQEVVDLGSYLIYDSYGMTHTGLYLLNTFESV